MKYSFRGLALALAALGLCAQPALAANKRAVVVSSGAIKPLPAGDTVLTNAATTANASINLPHGVAPTSPVNGDCWTTTTSAYCRINGATIDLATGGGGGGSWGSITGTLSAQTDLQAALDAKLDDSQATGFGLSQLNDADAAAGRTTLGLGTLATQSGTFSGTSSGTNTGDQVSIVGITGSLAEFNTALTAADFATGGGTATGTNTGDQDLSSYATTAAVAAGYQPLDGDLTSIAALTTTATGRGLLDDADQAALRTSLGLGTLATQSGTFSGTSSGTNTGDQTSIVGITGTLAEFDTAVSDANLLSVAAAAAAYQALDTQLTDVAGLAYAGNALKSIRVNAGETGWELATGGGGGTWGSITGTLSAQTDLQSALDLKAPLASPTFTGTVTLPAATVTLAKMADVATATVFYRKTAAAGAPEVQTLATLKTDLGLTGTNSGDQATIVGIAGSLAEFNTALTGADFASGGGTATGTNTGDQTTVSGNAGTATALATGRTLAITGDLAWTSPAFDGSGNVTAAGTIAAGAVTLANRADIATDSILGRATAATGAVEVLTALPWEFTGDVTRAADSNATAIATAAVSLAKMANMATDRLIGRDTAATGVPEALTVTGGVEFSGAGGIQRSALTGDVTATAGSNATTIANDAVTYAKLQNVSATSRAICRKTAAAGDAEECTLSEVLDFVGSAAQGDILYRGATTWARLAAGTNGQILQTSGAAANPSWVTSVNSSRTTIAGNSGTANSGGAGSETWQVLTADALVNATSTIVTVMTTSTIPAGTYKYRYDIIMQAAATTTSGKFSVDSTGTVTRTNYHLLFPSQGVTAATGIVDQDSNVTTGAVWAHQSARADNVTLGPMTDLDTANADVHYVIEGMLVTSTSGNLLLGHASELAAASTVMAGTMLQLWRLN